VGKIKYRMKLAHVLNYSNNSKEIENVVYLLENPIELRFLSTKLLKDICFSDIVDPLKENRDVNVVAVSVPSPNPSEEDFLELVEKALMLTDELNCNLLVLRPPKAKFTEEIREKLIEGHQLATQYNITLCWENLFDSNRVFKNIEEAISFLNEEIFFNCGISFDVKRVSEKRKTISEVLMHMGYIKLLRVPYIVFKKKRSNLYRLVKLLTKYDYRGIVVLYGKNASISEYNSAIKTIKEYLTTLKSITK